MHRVDTPGSTVDGLFQDGNPAVGQQATQLLEAWFNDVQENIAGVVEGAGIELSKGDYGQLLAAILALIAGSGAVPSSRTITAAGLATGGGNLAANRTITVAKASSGDVIAGTEAAKAISPDLLGTLFGIANPASLPTEIPITLPGGFQLRLGHHAAAMTEGSYAVDFVTPFSHAGIGFLAFPINTTSSISRDSWLQRISISATTMTVLSQWTGNAGTSDSLDGFDYIAFGC